MKERLKEEQYMSRIDYYPSKLGLQRSLLLVVHYFVGYIFLYPIIATKITLAINPFATVLASFTQWGAYVLTLGITVCLAWPLLKESYQNFIQDKRRMMKTICVLVMIMLIANIVLSYVVSLLTNTESSVNQTQIESTRMLNPLLTVFSTCIFAPIVEECVFRGGVFRYIRGKHGFLLATIISSLFFGSIHVMDSFFAGDFTDIAYVLVYAMIGIVLAIAYERTDSIITPICIHFISNTFAIILMFL